MKKLVTLLCTLLVAGVASAGTSHSAFSLSNVYSDHMVLQRGKPIRFAGTAMPEAVIDVKFRGQAQKVTTDMSGHWLAEFPAEEAGGPYEATFALATRPNTSTFSIKDVWVGDVWLCSGQSNMEYPVWRGTSKFFRYPDGDKVAAAANDPKLRLFMVPECPCVDGPCDDFPGRPSWKPATTPEAVGNFSAIGYFFGEELRRRVPGDVAIGLVCSSWGGTRIEPWIPKFAWEEAGREAELSTLSMMQLPFYKSAEYEKARAEKVAKSRAKMEDWLKLFFATDPAASAEALANWAKPGISTEGWTRGVHEKLTGLEKPGVVWYRFEFDLPAEYVGKPLVFHLDYVNDCDETFFDGVKIGATGMETPSYWAAKRDYNVTIPTAGPHVFAVRAEDHYTIGGIGKVVKLTDAGKTVVDFTEREWLERVEFYADIAKIGSRPSVDAIRAPSRDGRDVPSTLFNSMIAPLTAMNIRGVIWYQGCSNASAYKDYEALQPLQIEAWRKAFRDSSMPFILTQLSAFQGHSPTKRLADDFWKAFGPEQSLGYAPMRAVQQSMLKHPNTGVACTIDVGDHSDIHPWRKRPVAFRLANEAMRLAYGDATCLPGPRFASMTLEGEKGNVLRIRFQDVGDGLVANDDGTIGPHLFAVAGEKGQFHWAEAKLEADGSVLVWSDEVSKPSRVRYAYSAYPPDVTLRRKADNIPVFPFNQ